MIKRQRRRLYIGMAILFVALVFVLCFSLGLFHTKKRTLAAPADPDAPAAYDAQTLAEYSGDPVTITVYNSLPDAASGTQEGWFAQVLLEKFNIIWEGKGPYDEAEPEDCDIILWPSEASFEKDEKNLQIIQSLDDDFLSTYGTYMYGRFPEQLLSDEDGSAYSGFLDFYTLPRLWTVGKNTEHAALVVCFLDWMASREGKYTCQYGPEGLCWEYDEEGSIYLIEGYEQYISSGKDFPNQYGGGTFYSGEPLYTMREQD